MFSKLFNIFLYTHFRAYMPDCPPLIATLKHLNFEYPALSHNMGLDVRKMILESPPQLLVVNLTASWELCEELVFIC